MARKTSEANTSFRCRRMTTRWSRIRTFLPITGALRSPRPSTAHRKPMRSSFRPLANYLSMNPLLGLIYHWLGGLASASFYIPYRGVKKWSWETYWLVGFFFSWIIAPIFFALVQTKDLFAVLGEASAS